MKPVSLAICICFVLLLSLTCGCRQRSAKLPSDQTLQSSSESSSATAAKAEGASVDHSPVALPQEIEINAEALLAAQLTPDQLEEGWVRLFDGHSRYGWFVVGNADWQIAPDGVLKVTRGEPSFLCTSFQIADYELQVDFRCDAKTNSGIFMRCGPQPLDVGIDCFELNIAPADNPFPTGSLVQRKKVDPATLGDFDSTTWHTYLVRMSGNQVTVSLDGKQILQLSDAESSPTGHISLQHNSGSIEFRNILMRPLALNELKLGENWEEDWTLSEKAPGTFKATVTDEGLQLSGGPGQLQSKQAFGDFFLQARYMLANPQVNSGIFFRCVPEAMLDGYECQINHAIANDDPLRPLDAGAGAIFRRQPARIVMGDGSKPTYLTLLATGPQMITWVNGVQVAEYYDSREPNDNPRRGLRLEAGPIALQGHDATTDATFQSLKIVEIAK